MFFQREAFARRVAEPEFQLRRRIKAAVGEIAARLCADARGERRFKKFRGDLHDIVQRLAPRIALLVLARDFRQRHTRHLRQTFHGFGEADAFALHDEIEDAAVLAGGEIKPRLLLVVHEEGRRLLLVERRQALELAARAHELDALAHDFRHRKPGFELVEELGRETHGFFCAPGARVWIRRFWPIRFAYHRAANGSLCVDAKNVRASRLLGPYPSFPQDGPSLWKTSIVIAGLVPSIVIPGRADGANPESRTHSVLASGFRVRPPGVAVPE